MTQYLQILKKLFHKGGVCCLGFLFFFIRLYWHLCIYVHPGQHAGYSFFELEHNYSELNNRLWVVTQIPKLWHCQTILCHYNHMWTTIYLPIKIRPFLNVMIISNIIYNLLQLTSLQKKREDLNKWLHNLSDQISLKYEHNTFVIKTKWESASQIRQRCDTKQVLMIHW